MSPFLRAHLFPAAFNAVLNAGRSASEANRNGQGVDSRAMSIARWMFGFTAVLRKGRFFRIALALLSRVSDVSHSEKNAYSRLVFHELWLNSTTCYASRLSSATHVAVLQLRAGRQQNRRLVFFQYIYMPRRQIYAVRIQNNRTRRLLQQLFQQYGAAIRRTGSAAK